MTLLSALIIVVCFAVGGYFQFFSDKIDAPAEQVAESVLLTQGNIEVDFSNAKKQQFANQQKKEDEKKD